MSVLNYVSQVPTCLTCLHAHVPAWLTCLHFFTCLTCLYFFTCLKCLHFLRTLRTFIFLRVLIFLCAYIYLMYMLIKLTQINELIYLWLIIFVIIEFSHLSTFMKYFHFCKTRVIFCMSFFKRKTLITFNAEGNTWTFERLERYLEQEIQGMLKFFTIWR